MDHQLVVEKEISIKLAEENSELKAINRQLMEENEAYQLLLEEKTVRGEFLPPIHSTSESDSSVESEEFAPIDSAGSSFTEVASAGIGVTADLLEDRAQENLTADYMKLVTEHNGKKY